MSEKIKHLSFSGYGTYMLCPKKYDHHYNGKIRSNTTPMPLVFGSVVDKVLNCILMGEGRFVAMVTARKELARIFQPDVTVSEDDCDMELLGHESVRLLTRKMRSFGWRGNNLANLAKSTFERITLGEISLEGKVLRTVKFLAYYSLVEKIALMVEGFEDYVMPQLEEVISVQTHVKRGILDFKAKFKGIEGVVVCDNKTAARDYEPDAVRVSVQLAGYGAEKAAYIVFNKTVRKNRTKICSVCGNNGTGKRHKTCDVEVAKVRCNGEWIENITPEIIPQVIIDEVSQYNRNLVEEAYQETEALIQAKVFPRNLNNCSKQFGRPCEYFNLCWHNDMKGLRIENK